MNDQKFADKMEITELSNKLFMYVDAQQWDKVLDEVFTNNVWFDMKSAGGEAKTLEAKEVCEMWRQGLSGLDAVHHQAGHYLISVHEASADIYGYAIATHYKKSACRGDATNSIPKRPISKFTLPQAFNSNSQLLSPPAETCLSFNELLKYSLISFLIISAFNIIDCSLFCPSYSCYLWFYKDTWQ